ncbi:hypothetical protein J6590_015759 [Homalodisca vitripennis]|nr:hypothetical protein J6590_015759 [Homalodisca vitripennis]
MGPQLPENGPSHFPGLSDDSIISSWEWPESFPGTLRRHYSLYEVTCLMGPQLPGNGPSNFPGLSDDSIICMK